MTACTCGFCFFISSFRILPSSYTAAGWLLGSKRRPFKSPVGRVAAEWLLSDSSCCRHSVSCDRFSVTRKKPGGSDQRSWNMVVPFVSTAGISSSVSSEALKLHLKLVKSQANISRQERGVEIKCSDENLDRGRARMFNSFFLQCQSWLSTRL